MKRILSFPSHPKLLIDENVRIDLYRFLKREGYDVKLVPKSSPDKAVASLSKKEQRILVSNDSDFADPELYTSDDLFALIWLRVDQSDKETLIVSFQKLPLECPSSYKGKLIILGSKKWDLYDLGISFDQSS